MKVLVVGSGGREHAILWKLKKSPKVEELHAAPGNGGISNIATCHNVEAEDINSIVSLSKELNIDLVVIGPEVPLSMGIVDALEKEGIKTFGPNKSCSRLEGSKAFTKDFLKRHNIPTAGYREYTNKQELINDIGIFGYPMVIKADGLAAGKGVVIAKDYEEALKAINKMMGDKIFGSAADKIVVEEFLEGTEASVLCFVDEDTIVSMESAQDYKRIFDNDEGPNTGGMGTYSPSLIFTPEIEKKIELEILKPTLRGFRVDGLKFKGVLFIGLMIKNGIPKVIEFNNRFGDPETQSVLLRMETDLLDIFLAVCENRLKDIDIRWKEEKSICVILASKGYPGDYERGKKISGIDSVDEGVIVFHSGTKKEGEDILTAGGRVLGLATMAANHEEARKKVFDNIKKISFEGMQYRKDIGRIL